jgi:hypothetical protein
MPTSMSKGWGILGLLGTLAASGCDGGGSGTDAGDADGDGGAVCERVTELLEARFDCFADDRCPCGAHCELGICTHDCIAATDCAAGERCDDFGRCRSDDALVLPPDDSVEGLLGVDPPALGLRTAGALGAFRVRASGAPLEVVRVAAETGIEVQCDEAEPFGSECLLPDVQPEFEGQRTVRVRLLAAPSATETLHYGVDLFAGGQHALLGISVPQLGAAKGGGPLHPAALEHVGEYRGQAVLESSGLTSRPSAAPRPDLGQLSLPVRLVIHPAATAGEHVVTFADDLGAVFPGAETVGRLAADGAGGWAVEILPHHFLGPVSPGADDPEVVLRGASETIDWGDDRITMTLRTTFDGVTLAGDSPYLVWRIAATWVADPPAGTPPEIPPAYVPLQDPIRAASLSSAEALVLGALPLDLGASATERAAAVLCTPQGSTVPLGLQGEILQLASGPAPFGDLACAGDVTAAQTVFGLHAREGLTTADSDPVNAFVRRCLDDLARLGSLTGPTALDTDGCAAAGRAITAIAEATAVDRGRALGSGAPVESTASALGHRVLQQWVGLLGFIAHESLEVSRLHDVLPTVERPFTLEEALQASLDGWNLLLRPRVAVGLAALPPEVLGSPDYRSRLFPAMPVPDVRSHEQPVGLPVTLLGALRAQVEVLKALVEDARERMEPLDGVLPLLVDFLRRAFVVQAMAEGLYEASLSAGTPGWQPEWETTRLDWAVTARGLIESVREHRAGLNPLGIEDADLPLYRIGDEVLAGDRFSAVTDYLLGAGTSTTAIAPWMVDRARTQLDAVRDTWTRNMDRDFNAQLAATDLDRRLEGIRRRYGEEVASLCGNPSWDSATVLDQWDSINPQTCFIADACVTPPAVQISRLSSADIGRRICLFGRLDEISNYGVASLRYSEAEAARWIYTYRTIDSIYNQAYADWVSGEPFPIRVTAYGADSVTVAHGSTTWTVDPRLLLDMRYEFENATGDDDVAESFQECSDGYMATLGRRPGSRPSSCTMTDACPQDYVCEAGACIPDPAATLGQDPACFQGALGEVAIAVMSAANDVEIARSEAYDSIRRYDIAMQSCIQAAAIRSEMEAQLEAHNSLMYKYASTKLAFDIAANYAGAAKDSLDITSAFGAPAAVVEASCQSVSDGMEYAMGEAERAHEARMLELENALENATCLIEAEMELVGLETAELRVRQALLELGRQLVEKRNLETDVAGLLVEGHAALEKEASRRVSPAGADFWLDYEIERYHDYMRQARRTVYLAVMAAEYEFQFSSLERQRALVAASPDELGAVIDNLRAVVMTGTVGGASPSNLFAVVSLRDHFLQLTDRSTAGRGWHALTEAQRFQQWLRSETFAVYGADGTYLGQEIPFSIQPLGALGLADPHGMPILTGRDCAERLWSVNASLLGTDPYRGSDTTFTRVVLRKRNTFFSQWCVPPAGGAPFHVASTRPSRNLFLDPYGYGESLTPYTPEPDRLAVDETQTFTQARISAYFNVSRAELENETYFNGDSQELAGRGLYGDYALFFPAETLALGSSDGLVLQNIEDVLLRFDYVSVAR